jgi:hypothetical protein
MQNKSFPTKSMIDKSFTFLILVNLHKANKICKNLKIHSLVITYDYDRPHDNSSIWIVFHDYIGNTDID